MSNKKNHKINEKPEAEICVPCTEEVVLKKDEYEKLLGDVKKASESMDDIKRLQADFDNARKRLEKDRLEYIKHAKEDIIAELLGIVDNFRRADEAALKTKDFGLLHQGVTMILKEIKSLFEKNSVLEIPSVGEIFDPLKHEAIEYEIRNDLPDNTIVEELLKGYSMNGKIIRHAVVKVSKKQEEEKKDAEENKGQSI